jgi:hypothetical protein
MSRTEALRFAQYSANTRPSDVENPSGKAALARLMRQAVPLHVLVKRIAEGVSAEETKFFQKEGIVTDQRNVIAWSERREYLKLAAEYGQYIETKADQDAQSKVSVGFTLYNGITTPKNRGEAPTADEAPPKIDSEGFPVEQSQTANRQIHLGQHDHSSQRRQLMPDIPIPIETDDDTLRRQAAPIPVPMHPAYMPKAIANYVPLRNATGIDPTHVGSPTADAPPIPAILASASSPNVGGGPAPITPILAPKGKPIPMGRAPGISGTIDPNTHLYNTPPPNQAGVASLWSKAENIQNPYLRVLGEIGAGAARGLDTAGSIVAPERFRRMDSTSENQQVAVSIASGFLERLSGMASPSAGERD